MRRCRDGSRYTKPPRHGARAAGSPLRRWGRDRPGTRRRTRSADMLGDPPHSPQRPTHRRYREAAKRPGAADPAATPRPPRRRTQARQRRRVPASQFDPGGGWRNDVGGPFQPFAAPPHRKPCQIARRRSDRPCAVATKDGAVAGTPEVVAALMHQAALMRAAPLQHGHPRTLSNQPDAVGVGVPAVLCRRSAEVTPASSGRGAAAAPERRHCRNRSRDRQPATAPPSRRSTRKTPVGPQSVALRTPWMVR